MATRRGGGRRTVGSRGGPRNGTGPRAKAGTCPVVNAKKKTTTKSKKRKK